MSYKKKNRVDMMQVFSDMIADAIEELISDKESSPKWIKPWRDIDMIYRNYQYKKPYRGIYNQLICACANHSDPRFLTFNQISKMGGKVRKGAKGVKLIAWNILEKDKKDNQGNIAKDSNGNNVKIKFPMMKCNLVFNVSDTEGIEIEELPEVEDKGILPNDQVMEILKSLKVELRVGGNSAHYSTSGDYIQMPEVGRFTDSDTWSATMLHELGHYCEDRVGIDTSNYHTDKDERAKSELRVELASMLMSMKLRINGYMSKDHLAYVYSWSKFIKEDNKFLYNACKDAEKIVKYVFDNAGLSFDDEEMTSLKIAS
jgi:putative DNA primase/helicase